MMNLQDKPSSIQFLDRESNPYRVLSNGPSLIQNNFGVLGDNSVHNLSRILPTCQNNIWTYLMILLSVQNSLMVRYYGLYANAHRGKMRKKESDPLCPLIIKDEDPFIPSKGWAEMIKKVYGG